MTIHFYPQKRTENRKTSNFRLKAFLKHCTLEMKPDKTIKLIWILLSHSVTPSLGLRKNLNELEFRVSSHFSRVQDWWNQNKCHFPTCYTLFPLSTLLPSYLNPLSLTEIHFTCFWFIYIYFTKLFCKKHLMYHKVFFFSFLKNRTCSFNGSKHAT